MTRQKVRRVLFVILCSFLLISVVIPYGTVEFLTALHGNEFAKGYLQTRMIDNIAYLKVMTYSEHEAKVYYVEEGKTAGHTMTFARNGTHDWEYIRWETVWSTSGSASGFIWPYYR